MTKLNDILNVDLLRQHIVEGFVSVQHHPSLPLRIFNYTPRAQFEPRWGDGTIDFCRGLIVDDHDEIIARPFKKFHNINTESIPETHESYLKTLGEPVITEKLDGSLGILWQYDNHFGVATRGSFTSPQARWATDFLKANIHQYGSSLQNWTFLFEIIYKENRIVVDYDFEGLIVIGAVNNRTGAEMCRDDLKFYADWDGFPTVKQYKDVTLEELQKINRDNAEGFVVSYHRDFQPPIKVKVKMEDYVRLHKVITGMNPKSIWEDLAMGNKRDLSYMPSHFVKWYENWTGKLRGEYDRILYRVVDLYIRRPAFDVFNPKKSRAEYAKYLADSAPRELHGVLFAQLDGKNLNPIIWDMVKPRGDDKSFRMEGE